MTKATRLSELIFSVMTYSSYLKSVGAKSGEYNPFVMTKSEFLRFSESNKSITEKWEELNNKLQSCNDAWHNALMNGLEKDAEHAKINARNACKRLTEFELANGM